MSFKCSKCGASVDACDNAECINICQDSNTLNKKYGIFCDNGHHYCERECLVEEFRSCGIEGEEADLVEEKQKPKEKT